MAREHVNRIRDEVRHRIQSVGADPALYDVDVIAAKFRSLNGDRMPVASMNREEFWDMAARYRRAVS